MSQSQITKGRANDEAALASEKQLSEWLRGFDRKGALPAAEAALDVAYAQGYKKGLEEGRGDHLDSMKTLVMRILEAKLGELDDEAFERIETADVANLENWLLELLAHGEPSDEALGA